MSDIQRSESQMIVRVKTFYKSSNPTLPFGNTHFYKVIRKQQQ